jgi:hypothetical protein
MFVPVHLHGLGTQELLVRHGWQRRRRHLPQVVHRIVRPVRHAHLLENELLQVIVCFLPTHAVGMANHGGNGVDERLGDGASDFGWKPAEVISQLRAEGDRVIPVVIDPVARPHLTIVAVARRNRVSFWLWEVLPN